MKKRIQVYLVIALLIYFLGAMIFVLNDYQDTGLAIGPTPAPSAVIATHTPNATRILLASELGFFKADPSIDELRALATYSASIATERIEMDSILINANTGSITIPIELMLSIVELQNERIDILSTKVAELALASTTSPKRSESVPLTENNPNEQISSLSTKTANLEGIIESDSNRVIAIPMIERDVEQISDDVYEIKTSVNQVRDDYRSDLAILWGFVLATIFAIFLIALAPLLSASLESFRAMGQKKTSSTAALEPSEQNRDKPNH